MATTITRRLDVNWGATGVTLFVTVTDRAGTSLIARTSTGVTEDGSTGTYYYDASVSSDKDLRVTWDNGGTGVNDVLKDYYAAEDTLHNGAAITPVNQVTVGTINTGNLSQTNLTITQGDTYALALGTQLAFSLLNGETWPTDITGTLTFTATEISDNDDTDGTSPITGTGTVTQATGSSRAFYVELAAATTATMGTGTNCYNYDVQWASSTNRFTLRRGTLTVLAQQTSS